MIRQNAILIVVAPVILAGCGGSRVISTPMPIPTFDATPTLREFARTPTPTADSSATPMPQEIDKATATRTPTEPPLTSQPTEAATFPPRTAGPMVAEIHEFDVTPNEGLHPGDQIDVSWSAEGQSAQICIAAYDYYGGECWDSTVNGGHTFTIGNWEGLVTVTLRVISGESWNHVDDSESVRLFLGCTHAWVWNSMEGDVRCPGPQETWVGAVQPFEHGWMIWTGNHYYMLFDAPSQWNIDGARRLEEVPDPLDVTGDTSGQYSAPQGLYAPTSGFGIVWRGDAELSPGYIDAMGWAIQPEVRYEAIQQCWALKGYTGAAGGISECYFVHPAGGLIAIVRDGIQLYWEVIS